MLATFRKLNVRFQTLGKTTFTALCALLRVYISEVMNANVAVQGVVRTLMKLGMRANVTDASGKTALDVATRRAKDPAHDPLVLYMSRTHRVQALQSQGRQRRRGQSGGNSASSAGQA